MTTILLCRHAEVSNPANLFYGRMPRFGLSREGSRMASQLAGYLSREPATVIYHSPLLRTRQTAKAIAALQPADTPLRSSTLLHEVFNRWQGTSWGAIGAARFYDAPQGSGYDTVPTVADRMRRFFNRTIARHPGEAVIAVSHADPILIALMDLLGKPLTEDELRRSRDLMPQLASLNRLEFSDEGTFLRREYVDQRDMVPAVAL